MKRSGPRFYNSFAEFEREEIRPHTKAGWSLDDLYNDAGFQGGNDDRQRDDDGLNFDD